MSMEEDYDEPPPAAPIVSSVISVGATLGTRAYEVPAFQRQYEWTTANVDRLLKGTYDSFCQERPYYFLGSLVVYVKGSKHLVIDGQQRLTTLGLLISAARHLLETRFNASPELLEQMSGYICRRPRLTTRQLLRNPAPAINVISYERTDFRVDFLELPTSHRPPGGLHENTAWDHVIQNFRHTQAFLKSRFKETDAEKFAEYVDFLFEKVFFSTTETSDLEQAFEMFDTLNTTGLSLSACDKSRAHIMTGPAFLSMSETQRSSFIHAWNIYEETLGREEFEKGFVLMMEVFCYNMGDENFDAIMNMDLNERLGLMKPSPFQDPAAFGAEWFRPFMDCMLVVKTQGSFEALGTFAPVLREIDAKTNGLRIKLKIRLSHSIMLLNHIIKSKGRRIWLPCLMKAYQRFCMNLASDAEVSSALEFLTLALESIERIFGLFFLCDAKDLKKEREKAVKVICCKLEQIPIDADLPTFLKTLIDADLFARLKEEVGKRLPLMEFHGSDKNRRRGHYILRKYESVLAPNALVQHLYFGTLEHILPQNPRRGRRWLKDWTQEQRLTCVHMLGNLVLLSAVENGLASDWDYQRKRNTYFLDGAQSSTFHSTASLRDVKTWLFSDFNTRHRNTVKRILDAFDLTADPDLLPESWEALENLDDRMNPLDEAEADTSGPHTAAPTTAPLPTANLHDPGAFSSSPNAPSTIHSQDLPKEGEPTSGVKKRKAPPTKEEGSKGKALRRGSSVNQAPTLEDASDFSPVATKENGIVARESSSPPPFQPSSDAPNHAVSVTQGDPQLDPDPIDPGTDEEIGTVKLRYYVWRCGDLPEFGYVNTVTRPREEGDETIHIEEYEGPDQTTAEKNKFKKELRNRFKLKDASNVYRKRKPQKGKALAEASAFQQPPHIGVDVEPNVPVKTLYETAAACLRYVSQNTPPLPRTGRAGSSRAEKAGLDWWFPASAIQQHWVLIKTLPQAVISRGREGPDGKPQKGIWRDAPGSTSMTSRSCEKTFPQPRFLV
ncbi:uncharacterized protein EV422DRAFT_123518 [Fimicolochytrium jonesii]|uniref:uncharacterized protein n=1 Tax=Fimicolochytrium jonesii TaxID=1396493 RepID=UPI0022FDC6C2|nr:uncharacterized protein EV422DRAFT_123518 [Fimicolochytrium jonesii]KAI8819270.1 hypothetical protein EV422DRAFT_123518 [Fimicolochytrium jonesii]